MPINMELITKLREATGAGVLEAKQVLDDNGEDFEKAKEILLKKAGAKAAKKADRVIKDGLVYSYIHTGGRAGSLIVLGCETDFVARTDDFQKLCKEIAMQICSDDYANVDEVLASEYIRDPAKKIQDLVNELTAKVGEKIELRKFVKFSVTE